MEEQNISLDLGLGQGQGQGQQQPPRTTSLLSPNMDVEHNAYEQSLKNELISGLQQASMSGGTRLPNRDIPIDQSVYQNDEDVQYDAPIRKRKHVDFIEEDDSTNANANANAKYTQDDNNFLDDIQIPIILAILYFVFQLPVFKKIIYQNITFFFNDDGNYNMLGYIFVSVLFGSLYYVINRMYSNI